MIVVLMILVSLSGQTASPQLVVVAKDGKKRRLLEARRRGVSAASAAVVRGPSRLPTRGEA